MATFELTNCTDNSIFYEGYSPDQSLYQVQVIQGKNKTPVMVGWCGTGLVSQELKRRHSTEIKVYFGFAKPAPGSDAVEVGISISAKGVEPETIWSEPIPLM